MTDAIELNRVSKRFVLPHQAHSLGTSLRSRLMTRGDRPESFWAVSDVSFGVRRGETVGFIGSNGSGKSTVLKLIARILQPTSGRVEVIGRLSAMLELGAGFHQELSGRDNVFLSASLHGIGTREIESRYGDIVEFAELGRFIDAPVKHYSSGMYARLAFAISVHMRPDIVLIDEVLSVGDQAFQAKCVTRIHDLKKQGTTIVLVSHDLSTVQALCDRVIWLDNGRIQEIGNSTETVMSYLHHVSHQSEHVDKKLEAGPRLGAHNQWGSGKIQIVRVELCDGAGNERSAFVTGGPMEIRLHFRADEFVHDPVFGIAIHHENGTHITGPNTNFSGLHIAGVHGDGLITYRIASLPLLRGTYALTVAVVNREDTEMYDYHDRAYPFRVYMGRSREQYGIVALSGEWLIGEAERPEVSHSTEYINV